METKNLAKQEKNKNEITETTIKKYLQAMGLANKLTDNETLQFIEIAKMSNLNPFKNEIYCIKYNSKDGDKLSIVTGYEVYLKRAEKLGTLDGWECKTVGNAKDGTLKAVITIFRKDRSKPFVWDASIKEYNQNRNLWISKPETMLKKVAIAQAFRLCFPCDFDDLPYIEDELPNNMIRNFNDDIKNKSSKNQQEPIVSILDPTAKELQTIQGDYSESIETESDDLNIDFDKKLKELKESNAVKNFSINNYSLGVALIKCIDNILEENAPEYFQESCLTIADLISIPTENTSEQKKNLLLFFATVPKIRSNIDLFDQIANIAKNNNYDAMTNIINACRKLLR
jgi:phage recombination protein Bet